MTQKTDKVLLRRYHEEGDLAAREELIEQYMSLVRSLEKIREEIAADEEAGRPLR